MEFENSKSMINVNRREAIKTLIYLLFANYRAAPELNNNPKHYSQSVKCYPMEVLVPRRITIFLGRVQEMLFPDKSLWFQAKLGGREVSSLRTLSELCQEKFAKLTFKSAMRLRISKLFRLSSLHTALTFKTFSFVARLWFSDKRNIWQHLSGRHFLSWFVEIQNKWRQKQEESFCLVFLHWLLPYFCQEAFAIQSDFASRSAVYDLRRRCCSRKI